MSANSRIWLYLLKLLNKTMKKFLFALLLIAGCGSDQASSPQPSIGQKTTLALFGAPWCGECKHKLPQVNQLIQNESNEFRNAVSIYVYVPTGAGISEKPTQQTADKYKEQLGLSGEAKVDPWMWTNFKKWVGNRLELPAAVVLSEDGRVIRAFKAGNTSFLPEEIVRVLKENVQK